MSKEEKQIEELKEALKEIRDSTYRNSVQLRAIADRALEKIKMSQT